MYLVESVLEIFGVGAERKKAYQNIEQTGGIDILRNNALRLRAEGDKSATVLAHRSFGSDLLIALHYNLRRNIYLSSSWWDSIGVGLQAGSSGTPQVRFTDGSSWNYLDFKPKMNEHSMNFWVRKGLRASDLEMLQTDPATSLKERIDLAMKLARHQNDYRFGEGEGSTKGKLSRHYKLLMPPDNS